MKELKTIGVIGHTGMVGHTVFNYFKDNGYEVSGFSQNPTKSEREKTYSADVIFVCVPTPYLWDLKAFDGSIVREVVSEIPDGKVVVIKSTVPIGTTEELQKEYLKLKLLFNPEFLSEATCDEDFRNPDRQFVGYTKESYPVSVQVLNLLPESAYEAIMPAKEAELLKYINNIHGTIEIMESNMYWEVCEEEGLDYDRVLKAALASKWVGVSMGRHYRVIFHKNKRGFGGKCFPKDINAWIDYLNAKGIDSKLPTAVRDMNVRILASQGYTEEDAEKL